MVLRIFAELAIDEYKFSETNILNLCSELVY